MLPRTENLGTEENESSESKANSTISVPYPSLSFHSEPSCRPLHAWRLSLSLVSPKNKRAPNRMGPRSAGQLQSMFSSGMQRCTLKSLGLTSLYGIGVQYEVKRIYLQQNLLTSFEGWEYQPDLVELNAEDNRIENFR
jgi:hypothetical protein